MRSPFIVVGACCVLLAVPAGSQNASPDAVQRANDLMRAQKNNEAVKLLKDTTKRDPQCGECYSALAVAYMRMGDASHALQSCDKALALIPDTAGQARIHDLKGRLLLSRAYEDKKALALAESEFRAAVAKDNTNAPAHFGLAIALLREMKDQEGLAEARTYLEMGGGGSDAARAQKMLAHPARAREEFAPDFQVTTLSGETYSSKQLAGRFVVLDFWATWCPPCRASIGELRELSQKYPAEQALLISISADEDEKTWQDFVAAKKMQWAQVWDGPGRVAELFGVQAFPTYIVIDGEGVIVKRISGLNPQQSVAARLKDELKKAMQEAGSRGRSSAIQPDAKAARQ